MNYYLTAFKNYAKFSGRASRSEYWYFVLFNLLALIALKVISSIIHTTALSDIYSLVSFIPSISVGVRRIHDINKSGWFLLIPIYSLILLIREGVSGDNQYGSYPKE